MWGRLFGLFSGSAEIDSPKGGAAPVDRDEAEWDKAADPDEFDDIPASDSQLAAFRTHDQKRLGTNDINPLLIVTVDKYLKEHGYDVRVAPFDVAHRCYPYFILFKNNSRPITLFQFAKANENPSYPPKTALQVIQDFLQKYPNAQGKFLMPVVVAAPFGILGGETNHIVLVEGDFETKKIIIHDSKSSGLIYNFSDTLHSTFKLSGWDIKINYHEQQTGHDACGYFVHKYIVNYLDREGNSNGFNEITLNESDVNLTQAKYLRAWGFDINQGFNPQRDNYQIIKEDENPFAIPAQNAKAAADTKMSPADVKVVAISSEVAPASSIPPLAITVTMHANGVTSSPAAVVSVAVDNAVAAAASPADVKVAAVSPVATTPPADVKQKATAVQDAPVNALSRASAVRAQSHDIAGAANESMNVLIRKAGIRFAALRQRGEKRRAEAKLAAISEKNKDHTNKDGGSPPVVASGTVDDFKRNGSAGAAAAGRIYVSADAKSGVSVVVSRTVAAPSSRNPSYTSGSKVSTPAAPMPLPVPPPAAKLLIPKQGSPEEKEILDGLKRATEKLILKYLARGGCWHSERATELEQFIHDICNNRDMNLYGKLLKIKDMLTLQQQVFEVSKISFDKMPLKNLYPRLYKSPNWSGKGDYYAIVGQLVIFINKVTTDLGIPTQRPRSKIR